MSSSSPQLLSATARASQNDKPASGGAFGRPAFGKPAFGNAGGFGSKPAFGSGKVELTEEEKRLADQLKAQTEVREAIERQGQEAQRRSEIRINRGLGPETSRAGRPDPQSYNEKSEARERREQAREKAAGRLGGGGGAFRINRIPVRDNDDAPSEPRQPRQPREGLHTQWNGGQLRQRQQEVKREGHEDQPRSRGFTSPNTRFAGAQPEAPAQGGFRIRRPGPPPGVTATEGWGQFRPPTDRPARRARAPPPEIIESEPVEYQQLPEEVTPQPSEAVLRLREEEAERQREIEERRLRREKERYVEDPVEVKKAEHPEYVPRGKGKGGSKQDRRADFITDATDDFGYSQAAARAEAKKTRKAAKLAKKKAEPTPIFLPEYISIGNLATALRVRYDDFVAKLEELGFEETAADYILNGENAALIAQEYNYEALIDKSESEDLKPREQPEDTSIYPPRPPVVTIMGHVDHGKTTILDYLRKSSVAAGEAGGITQHIGAFSVPMPSGKVITFLDTPGHAAFLSMRQRGANVTDIVVLVVAADDSVKPQTIEAINHAKGAKVPIIVAINKVDKPEADINRVKQDLARHNVEIEDYGGDTQVVCISGKTGQGMDELEEAILTLSDVIDMRADPEGQAEGVVLEASVKSMGKVATILVRHGTMRPGDFIVAGNTWARIRCMRNEAGQDVEFASPGHPVEIDGWREQPLAGDEVLQTPTEQKAKSVVEYRLEAVERDRLAEDMEAINEERKFVAAKRAQEKASAAEAKKHEGEEGYEHEVPEEAEGGPRRVYFIIKGDVSGSVEAVVDSIAVVGNSEIQPYVLRSGVGPVSEFDIEHAAVAKGYIINFSQQLDGSIKRKADRMKVGLLDHDIIYKLVDDIKDKLSEFLPPIITQKVVGEAEIAQVFDITIKGRKQKPVAGCKIRNGTIGRNSKVRVIRKGTAIYDGMIISLSMCKAADANMK